MSERMLFNDPRMEYNSLSLCARSINGYRLFDTHRANTQHYDTHFMQYHFYDSICNSSFLVCVCIMRMCMCMSFFNMYFFDVIDVIDDNFDDNFDNDTLHYFQNHHGNLYASIPTTTLTNLPHPSTYRRINK